ncbi:MAG: hypothetical protein HKN94_15595, partial [Acidimicrobiales bacterium]|nr:hypothetical protein [Acidimicrobiales bacterium]
MTTSPLFRRAASLLLLALVAAGCGLLGDDDAPAVSDGPDDVEVTNPTVRVSHGDRWFDVSESELDADFDQTLPTKVAALDVEIIQATDASIRFRDGVFEVVESTLGRAPDFDALATDLRDALTAGTEAIS